MKYLLLFFLSYAVHTALSQQVITIGAGANQKEGTVSPGLKNGQPVPDIRFGRLLNSEKQNVSLSELKGRIVILEFWATWCSPCIPAMKHLNELKRKFPHQLEVIAISNEEETRIQRFINQQPSSIHFYSDPGQTLQKYFPFHTIPHSVIIDQEGKLVANTSPADIGETILKAILNKQKVAVKEKKDDIGNFDMAKDYFPRPAGFNEYSFEVQSAIAGGFPITRRNAPKSEWFGRRLTMLNNPINLIYRNAFNKSNARTVYEGVTASDFDHRTTKDLFCIDVIVPKGKESELHSYLQQQLLLLNLPYKCRIEKRKMECVVMNCTDPSKLESFRSAGADNITPQQPTVIRATSYDKKNVPLDDLFLHFENYGILKQPVINETGLRGSFDLTFQFDAENPADFKNALAKMGLKGEKKEREVEVIVIYKN